MHVYWKPKYGTRSSRHKAWTRQEAKREQRLQREPRRSLCDLLRRLIGRD